MNEDNIANPKLASLIREESDAKTDTDKTTHEVADLILERGMSLSEPVLDLLLKPFLHCQLIVDRNNLASKEYSFPTHLSFSAVIDMERNNKGNRNDTSLFNLIKFISKGVNKKNKIPVIFHKMKEDIIGSTQEDHRKIQRCVIINDNYAKLSKKNLMTYYNYADSDASSFMKNIHSFAPQGVKVSDILLLKDDKISTTKWFMLGILFSMKGIRVDHWVNLNIMENNIQYESGNNLTPEEHAEKNMNEINFVSTDLDFWKGITQWWIDNNNEQIGDLTKLNKKTRDRLIVNTIRHNAINYVISWLYLKDKKIHDAMFCLINRDIANRFPTLRNEAMNQVELRNYEF